MFEEKKTVLVPLNQLRDWSVDDAGVTCSHEADYMVRYYDIDITGRESVNCSKRDPFGPCLRILYVLRCWICADLYLKLPVCLGAKAYHAGL